MLRTLLRDSYSHFVIHKFIVTKKRIYSYMWIAFGEKVGDTARDNYLWSVHLERKQYKLNMNYENVYTTQS